MKHVNLLPENLSISKIYWCQIYCRHFNLFGHTPPFLPQRCSLEMLNLTISFGGRDRTYFFLLQVKKPEKWSFWGFYSKAKKERNQSNLFFFDDFDRFIPWTNTYFLEVRAYLSLKLTTNGSANLKNLHFWSYSKAKRRSTTKIICVFWWFWKGKQTWKINIFEAIIVNQKRRSNSCFWDGFGRYIPSSTIY